LNHVVVVREDQSRERPDVVRAIFRRLSVDESLDDTTSTLTSVGSVE
jgi:hypothetical protein